MLGVGTPETVRKWVRLEQVEAGGRPGTTSEESAKLKRCLDGLTEEQVRRSLVPSRTTLLGLVKHTTFVEKVWFDEAVTCRSRAEIGIHHRWRQTPSPRSNAPTATHVNHHDARRHRSGWTWSTATGAAR